MRPIEFEERNVVYAKDQKEYLPLPAHKTEDGQVIFCESLSLKERIRVLLTGKIWVSLFTFNSPLQPSFFTTKKSDLFVKK